MTIVNPPLKLESPHWTLAISTTEYTYYYSHYYFEFVFFIALVFFTF